MEANFAVGIVVPNDFIQRLPFGGASGFIQNIVRHIDRPVVIFGSGAEGTALWQPRSIGRKAEFIATYRLKLRSLYPLRLRALLGYLKNRRRILASGIGLLYVHSPECALPFLSGRSKVPVVFHQHGSGNPVTTAKYGWARNAVVAGVFDRMHQAIYRRADWVIAIDRLCLAQAVEGGAGAKTSLIMNAVDTETFRPDPEHRADARKALGIRSGETAVLFAGRLEEIKRVDCLIESLLHLGGHLEVRLLIAGDGTLRNDLARLARNLGVESRVNFLGKISHDRLPAYYNAADILALPSKMEGVPMAVLEALACGTPVVASAVGGLPDIVRNGINGRLLRDVTPNTLADGLREVAGQPVSRTAVAETVARWGAEKVARDLSAIFQKLAGR